MSVPVTAFKPFYFDLSVLRRLVGGHADNPGYLDSLTGLMLLTFCLQVLW